MTPAEAAAVRRHVGADAPVERAFTVFTERSGDFKPPGHNLLGAPEGWPLYLDRYATLVKEGARPDRP